MGTGEGNRYVLETLLQGMRGKSVCARARVFSVCVCRWVMGGEKRFGESLSWTNDENFHFPLCRHHSEGRLAQFASMVLVTLTFQNVSELQIQSSCPTPVEGNVFGLSD